MTRFDPPHSQRQIHFMGWPGFAGSRSTTVNLSKTRPVKSTCGPILLRFMEAIRSRWMQPQLFVLPRFKRAASIDFS